MNWCEFCQQYDDTTKWRHTPDGDLCLCAECWLDVQATYHKEQRVP